MATEDQSGDKSSEAETNLSDARRKDVENNKAAIKAEEIERTRIRFGPINLGFVVFVLVVFWLLASVIYAIKVLLRF